MKLEEFQINHFRSIYASGYVKTGHITALVGKNESGKTNVLYALERLNSSMGNASLSFTEDYPSDLDEEHFDPKEDVVDCYFELEPSEREELANIWPRAKTVTHVWLAKKYDLDAARGKLMWITFHKVAPITGDSSPVEAFRERSRALRAALGQSPSRRKAAEKLPILVKSLPEAAADLTEWKQSAHAAIDAFKKYLSDQDIRLTRHMQSALDALSGAIDLEPDDKLAQKARNWVARKCPKFVYFDEYPDVPGRQDIVQYIERQQSKSGDASDDAFGDLLIVAGIKIGELHSLLNVDQQKRQRIVTRASRVITERIRSIWRARDVRIRLDVDGTTFNVLVSDAELDFGAEINLEDRSRGFQWFFGFFVTFAAAQVESEGNADILLLDEPGLYLHASAQADLLRHFDDLPNQIIFTTHSPFMIPLDDPTAVKVVNFDPDKRTTISEHPVGDAATLFPLQAALGYEITQSLFIGPRDVLVEGVTDYWYLSSISNLLNATDASGIAPDVVLTPAHGADKTPSFASLLRSQNIAVILLLDSSAKMRTMAKDEIVSRKILRDDAILFVGDFHGDRAELDSDMEDLLDPELFDALVAETYGAEIMQRLELNANIPRIVSRFEHAFTGIGQTFHKTRPAKRFLEKISRREITLSNECMNRFRLLATAINIGVERQIGRQPFQ